MGNRRRVPLRVTVIRAPAVRPRARLPADSSFPGQSPASSREAGGRQDRHVGADLGHDDLAVHRRTPRDRAEQLTGGRERGDLLLSRRRAGRYGLVEEVDVGEARPDDERVLSSERRRALRAVRTLKPRRRF